MRLPSLRRRRPSAALLISSLALFISLGGAGYAAVSLPANSVGSRQLQNEAVTYTKIAPNAVGTVRANLNQLQARVGGTCGLASAIGAITKSGKVECLSTLPQESGVSNTVPLPVPSALTIVNSLQLQGTGTYMVWANPTITVTGNGTAQRLSVSCTLTVGAVSGGGAAQTRTATINTGTATTASSTSIPLQVAGNAGASGVSCASSSDATTAATVSVTSAENAIQTAS